MRRGTGLAWLLLCLALVVLAQGAAHSRALSLDLRSPRSPDPVLFAGDRFEGIPLTAVLRRADSLEYVSFVYGDCFPESDAGCPPPLEIQVWPACRRHLALYERSPGLDVERTTVRGVPAAVLDGGTRMELHTGASTIVVFADSRQRLSRIARVLRSLDASVVAGVPLPPPSPGAVEGRLAC